MPSSTVTSNSEHALFDRNIEQRAHRSFSSNLHTTAGDQQRIGKPPAQVSVHTHQAFAHYHLLAARRARRPG